MATEDDSSILLKLGAAIDTSLVEWEVYLETLTENSTYEDIILNDIQDATTKANALLHLLDVLPTRHAALVISYGDANIKFLELSLPSANLLAELQNPESDVELKAWFNRTMMSKKLSKSISQFEKDILAAEQGRLQELRRLKAIHFSLTKVSKDGELGSKVVEKLLDAMEEIGISLMVPGAFSDTSTDVRERADQVCSDVHGD